MLKVYVVEGANYQLLLGNSFMFDVGAGLFPKWQRVILTTPVKLELHATLDPIRRDTSASLHDEAAEARVVVHRMENGLVRNASKDESKPRIEEIQDDEVVELNHPVTVTYISDVEHAPGIYSGVDARGNSTQEDSAKFARGNSTRKNLAKFALGTATQRNTTQIPAPRIRSSAGAEGNPTHVTPVLHMSAVGSAPGSAYRLGMRDLVSEVEEAKVEPIDRLLTVLTIEFVESSMEFGDCVPAEVRTAVCQDVIDYAHAFSWNAFDLGCIMDMPHRVIRVDSSPAVQPSRRHLYTQYNDAILHTKCDPYIDMGIFKPATPECKDRAQLTIVRTAVSALGQDRNDPKYCRIAHDFRAMNDKIQLDPEPVDSVPDMLAWMGDAPTGLFFKTDADRGFYQIVCADDSDSIDSTCFELFHKLWVSTRMLFGQKNGPATFKRNATIMQEELLELGKTKSYFDDIIGKAAGGGPGGGGSDFDGLRRIWRRLLELAAKHGWKFKPAKTKWGFTTIETVGFEWSPHGIGVGRKMTNAVKSLVFPRNKSELRGLLGLANQFRERIAGYALLVTALTALTRSADGSGKKDSRVVATPEALIEFENLKVLLNSPPILQQFRYDRPTVVYTDASIGTAELPVGLGAVIVQTDDDGKDYVCAYASAGLTTAQKNYHIVRLELLAFVFACGKFYDWLAGIQFVWRSDCRAHEFLHEAKLSTNHTIARYALTLSEFNYRVECVSGARQCLTKGL